MSRDITLLHPALQEIIAAFLSDCEQQGLKAGISETLRTRDEQNALYAKGRFGSKEPVVTKVQYPYSFHCWGLAFDIYRNDGAGAYSDAGQWFSKAGRIGQALGLTWGGAWTSFIDKPHFQLDHFGKTCRELVNRYRTPEQFFATWKTPPSLKKPTLNTIAAAAKALANAIPEPSSISKTSSKEEIRWLQSMLNKQSGANLAVDGIWGKRTSYALFLFQTQHSLRDDLSADPKTIALLKGEKP